MHILSKCDTPAEVKYFSWLSWNLQSCNAKPICSWRTLQHDVEPGPLSEILLGCTMTDTGPPSFRGPHQNLNNLFTL